MNRKAKRNKYKKLNIKYRLLNQEFENYRKKEAFIESQKQRETITFSSMLFSEDVVTARCVLGEDKVFELRQHELVKSVAANLASNIQLFKQIPCDIGIRYDLQIVIPKD